MRQIGRPPNLVQVLVLILVFVTLTLEVRDSLALEIPPAAKVSYLQPPIAAEREVFLAATESAYSGGSTVHCSHGCLHTPAVRPRADYLWLLAMLVAVLAAGPLGSMIRRGRPPSTRRGVTATGAAILLHLCVCRR